METFNIGDKIRMKMDSPTKINCWGVNCVHDIDNLFYIDGDITYRSCDMCGFINNRRGEVFEIVDIVLEHYIIVCDDENYMIEVNHSEWEKVEEKQMTTNEETFNIYNLDVDIISNLQIEVTAKTKEEAIEFVKKMDIKELIDNSCWQENERIKINEELTYEMYNHDDAMMEMFDECEQEVKDREFDELMDKLDDYLESSDKEIDEVLNKIKEGK